MTSLLKYLLPGRKGVVSIVGAGGKSTLMFHLAHELALSGKSVLTTTTTKILMPTVAQSEHVIISNDQTAAICQAGEYLRKARHVTIGKEHIISKNKLVGFDAEAVTQFWESGKFAWVLIEADGAAHRPLKAPGVHEPVIPDCSTIVMVVVGLDVLGKPLTEKTVFRSQLYSKITGLLLNSPVTERSVASIILHDHGLLKGCPLQAKRYVFLNKADDEFSIKAGRRIGSILKKEGKGKLDKVFTGALQTRLPIVLRYESEIG